MNRREALGVTMKLMGTTIIGSEVFLSGCVNRSVDESNPANGAYNVNLLDEVAETILPHSEDSPGAREAMVGEFMKTIVNDCYTVEEQEIFQEGIENLQKRSKEVFGDEFMELDNPDRVKLLSALDLEAKQSSGEEPVHYFTMIKQLTIWGYFTSEPGATKALRYNPIPGKYLGCEEYNKGEKAWA